LLAIFVLYHGVKWVVEFQYGDPQTTKLKPQPKIKFTGGGFLGKETTSRVDSLVKRKNYLRGSFLLQYGAPEHVLR
jgi:hypothetical protein